MSFQYSAPTILNELRPFLDIPRLQYSDSFPKFLVAGSEERVEYREGLIAIGGCIGLFFFLWGSILLILRCAGKSAGCAAGYAFDKSLEGHKSSNNQYDLDERGSQLEGNGFQSPQISYDRGDYANSYDAAYVENFQSKRERRTQSCFLLFSMITILCVPPIIILVVEPLKSTTESFETQAVVTNDLLGQVGIDLMAINSSLGATRSIYDETPDDFSTICPFAILDNTTLDADVSEADLNNIQMAKISLMAMHKLILNEVNKTQHSTTVEIEEVDIFHSKFKTSFEYVDSVQQEVKTYVWILPILLFGTVSATLVLMIAVWWSRSRQSSERFRLTLPYLILPVVLASAGIACLIAILAAVSVVIADDACNNGSEYGTPHESVIAILDTFQTEPDDSIYIFADAFSGECANGTDPTERLRSLESDVQKSINDIWTTLAEIDKVDRGLLANGCGAENFVIENFLLNSRNLAMFLTSIRRALSSMTETLSCDQFYPLYVESVEVTMCTEVPESAAWALIFFCLLGVSTMCMVTLRAAWQHEEEEEDIYGEDEEIENMFVDEHEEYLAYISKYKHEWEDYEGMDPGKPLKAPQALYPAGYGATFGTGSKTHSDTDSGGEARLNGEELFEDEHFLNLQTNLNCSKPDNAEEGPFDTVQTETYSPMTIESEITFMSMRDNAGWTRQAPTTSLEEVDRASHLFGASSRDSRDFGHDEFVHQLTMVIEEQSSRDIDLVRHLSRDVERQNAKDFRTMKELALPPDGENDERRDGDNAGKRSSPKPMELLPTKSTESSAGSTDTDDSDEGEAYYFDDSLQEESVDESKTMDGDDVPSSPFVTPTAQCVSVGHEGEIGVKNDHFFDDEVPSSPTGDDDCEVNGYDDREQQRGAADPDDFVANNMAWDGFDNPRSAMRVSRDGFFDEGPSTPVANTRGLVVAQSSSEEVDEQPPMPVNSFDPPAPVDSFDQEPLTLDMRGSPRPRDSSPSSPASWA
ncbi:hypothetical protein ACA910_014016 [Epithemia clementina (nom. ined.)]